MKIYKVDTPSVEGGDINLLLFPIYIFGIFYHEHTLVKMQNYSKKILLESSRTLEETKNTISLHKTSVFMKCTQVIKPYQKKCH